MGAVINYLFLCLNRTDQNIAKVALTPFQPCFWLTIYPLVEISLLADQNQPSKSECPTILTCSLALFFSLTKYKVFFPFLSSVSSRTKTEQKMHPLTVMSLSLLLLFPGSPECCHHGPPGPALQPGGCAGPDAWAGGPPVPPAHRLPAQGGLGVQEGAPQGILNTVEGKV